MENNPLEKYFRENRKNVIHKWLHYFEIYHKHLGHLRNKACVVAEIGVAMGGSLQMWREYFGPQSIIVGIDINPNCKQFTGNQIFIETGDQADTQFLESLKEKYPPFDVIIDDGGHFMHQQITAFEVLYDHLKTDGVYICEDTHTSYWEEYGGARQLPSTFIEYTKRLIDDLHAWHQQNATEKAIDFAKHTQAIHFYDSVVVLEKRLRDAPYPEKTGGALLKSCIDFEEKEKQLFKLMVELLGVKLPENIGLELFMQDTSLFAGFAGEKFEGLVWPENGETMIGYKRLKNIEYCMRSVIENNIEGDVIETGVWKGGSCIFMKGLLDAFDATGRKVWVADSFEGVPAPNPKKYPHDAGLNLYEEKTLKISLEDVQFNFLKYNLLDEKVVFLKGWFKDTLAGAPIEKLSVLRLDGDLYESTIDSLFYLYPKLAAGGYCIIDDFGAIPACRKAVEDYRRIMQIEARLEWIDWTGIFWRKERQVKQMAREAFDKEIEQLNIF